jgi:YD repeat-containing protein
MVTSPITGTSQTAVVAYTYDELGRVVGRTLDGGSTVGTTFDALGRVTNVTNPLAASMPGFQYSYVDETSRLHSVTYPAGTHLSTVYNYYGNVAATGTGNGDQRLQEIQNLQGTTPISDFQYTYNPVGTIATWTQQADSATPVVDTLAYDNADQLTKSDLSGGTTGHNYYNYDPAGNRLLELP